MRLLRISQVVGLITVAAAGCGKRVDCNEFCERKAKCVAEISVVLGKASPEQTAKLTDEDRKSLGEHQRTRCRPDCASPTKPSSVHTKWRNCMKADGCFDFASCVYR